MSIEFILGLLLAIPLNILGNVLTRKYDDITAKRSVIVREKRLKTLIKEYAFITSLKKDKWYATFTMFRWAIMTFYYLGIFIGCVGATIGTLIILESSNDIVVKILSGVTFTLVVLSFIVFRKHVSDRMGYISKLNYYVGYRRNVLEQVEKLGGKLEDLNLEEI